MLKSNDMKKILANASKRISKFGMEAFEKGRTTVNKHFSIIQKDLGSDLKDTKFLYSTGEVEGFITKKFKYAILFSADTFYFFDSSKYSSNIVAKYTDIKKVTQKDIYLTVTLKNGKKFKSTCYRAEAVAILIDEVVKYVQPAEVVTSEPAPAPVEPKPAKKKTTTKKATETKGATEKPKAEAKPKAKKVETSKSEEKPKAEAKSKATAKKAATPKAAAEKPAAKKAATSKATVKKAVEEKPKTVAKKTATPKKEEPAAPKAETPKSADTHIEKLMELVKLPTLGEVVPVPLQDTSKVKAPLTKKKDLLAIAAKFNGARGIAFFSFSGISVAEDTEIRSKCRDLNMDCSLMASDNIRIALEATCKDKYFEDFRSGKFVILFNDLMSYIDLVIFIKGLNMTKNILSCVFEGEQVSVEDVLEFNSLFIREKTFAELKIDKDELFSVLAVRNNFHPENALEFGDRLLDFNSGKTIKLSGTLPETVLSCADACDALVTATMYARNGYEVIVFNKDSTSIFDMTDAVKTCMTNLPNTDKQVQLIYQGTFDNVNSQTDETELIIEVNVNDKVSCVREIKSFMDYTLLEAKNFVDSCPRTLTVNKSQAEIAKFVEAFDRIGGKVTLSRENYLSAIYDSDSKKVCGYTLINPKARFFGESADVTRSANSMYGYTNQSGAVDLWLIDGGPNRIEVIKWVKSTIGLGLKESKELVEKAPVSLIEGLDTETADTYRAQLSQIEGAKIEFRSMANG